MPAFAVLIVVAIIAGTSACPRPTSFACAEDEDCAPDQECADDLVCRDGPAALPVEGEGEEGEGEEGEGEEGEGEGEGEPCPPITGATVSTFQQHCYVAFLENESWARGVVRCAQRGGYLAVPSSTAEQEHIASSLVLPGLDPTIGLTDAHDEGVFTSIVGESLPLDLAPFFVDGEPNDGALFGREEDCLHFLEVDDSDGVLPAWNDERCNEVVSEGDALVTSTLCELPFDGDAGFCGDGVVQAAFGECDAGGPGDCPDDCQATFTPDVAYEAVGTPVDRVFIGFAAARSFFAALESCETLGGTLALPDSGTSDDSVTRIIERLGGASLWIGYQDRFLEAGGNAAQFRRSDDGGEIGDGFEAFGGGEPNDANDGEDCVEARGASGWNDNDCNDARGFICELK